MRIVRGKMYMKIRQGQRPGKARANKMATIEYLNKRIEGKHKEITKLESKLARIEKAQASNWENNPYYYHESDLKWTTRDLEAAREALKKYEAELATATEKANSRNVKAILDFLTYWQERAKEFYRKGLEEYFETRNTLRQLYTDYSNARYGTPEREEAEKVYREAEAAFRCKMNGYYHKETYEWRGHIHEKSVKDRDGELEYIRPYNNERNIEDAMAKVAKDLKNEADRKYDDIIERTNYAIGQITDASMLRVGSTRGELNGFIIGERGKVEVESILAGGYNIQCLHIRTLIKKCK